MLIAIISIGSIIVLSVAIGLFLSTKYSVRSEQVINAPRQRVHELIADLNEWEHWEPWREKDPSVKITRSDQTAGAGAQQSWTDKSGGGELTFTRADPGYGIDYDLLFANKYACKASMTHEPAGDGQVRVVWAMSGDTETPIIGGYFALLMPRFIKPMFDRGLEKLKQAAESESTASVT